MLRLQPVASVEHELNKVYDPYPLADEADPVIKFEPEVGWGYCESVAT